MVVVHRLLLLHLFVVSGVIAEDYGGGSSYMDENVYPNSANNQPTSAPVTINDEGVPNFKPLNPISSPTPIPTTNDDVPSAPTPTGYISAPIPAPTLAPNV
eukprot:325870_1